MTKPKIFNFSNRLLSQQHVNVLHRGFRFTPTSLPKKTELKNNVQEFSRMLDLLEFFIWKVSWKKRNLLMILL